MAVFPSSPLPPAAHEGPTSARAPGPRHAQPCCLRPYRQGPCVALVTDGARPLPVRFSAAHSSGAAKRPAASALVSGIVRRLPTGFWGVSVFSTRKSFLGRVLRRCFLPARGFSFHPLNTIFWWAEVLNVNKCWFTSVFSYGAWFGCYILEIFA